MARKHSFDMGGPGDLTAEMLFGRSCSTIFKKSINVQDDNLGGVYY